MDGLSRQDTAMVKTPLEDVNGTVSSPTDAGPEIHPIIASAEALDFEDDPHTESNTSQATPVFSSPKQDIEEDTDLDIFYDISHVSHDRQTANSHQEEPLNDDGAGEDLFSKPVDKTEEQMIENGEVVSLAEVEVWDVVENTGHHTVATVDPDKVTSDGNAIINEEAPMPIAEVFSNTVTDLLPSDEYPASNEATDISTEDEQVSSNEEAPIWLVVLALTVWCCVLVILVWLIRILVHSTNREGIFEAAYLPLAYIDNQLSLKQAKAVDFAAAAVIAPTFIAFANFTWFRIGRKLSPKTDVPIEIPKEDAGTFNVGKILSLVKTSKPQLILLAILLFSSALASTFLSNILGYKAVSLKKLELVPTELVYQIVYIPGLLVPALCAFTSASTAAFLLVVLEWTSALSNRKQASAQANLSQATVTDEHDVRCDEINIGHNYVSFPHFRTGRRLFSRTGIGIFRGASGDGELEPLLPRTRSQVEDRATPGSWRLPSFEFPSFRFSRKVIDSETLEEVDPDAVPQQSDETPRGMSGWKFPPVRLLTWGRAPSPFAIVQQESCVDVDHTNPNEPSAEYIRKGRKFWKLLTSVSSSFQHIRNPSTEATQSSSTSAVQISSSLWNLRFPDRFLWPSGNWRTHRRRPQREEASETSSLLSQVESEQVALPDVSRTSSLWNFMSPAGYHEAPGSKGRWQDAPTGNPTFLQQENRSDVNSYASESWRSWMVPRISFLSSRNASSDNEVAISPTLHETDEQPRNDMATSGSHGTVSIKVRNSQKRDYSSSFSWFPSFKFPTVVVDVPPANPKRPTLLPDFEESPSKDVTGITGRIVTAPEALNVAIGKQSASSVSRSEGTVQIGQIFSNAYTTNDETMSYNPRTEATLSNERDERTLLRNNGSKRSAVTSKVDNPPSQADHNSPFIHRPIFTTKRKHTPKTTKLTHPIPPIQNHSSQSSALPPPSYSPIDKGKQKEQYVDKFESTFENLHDVNRNTPVLIHEEIVVVQPTKIYTEDDIVNQRKSLGIGSNPFGSRRLRADDVEAGRNFEAGGSRSVSPLRRVAGSYRQLEHEAGHTRYEEQQVNSRGKTWREIMFPHLISTFSSPSSSINPTSRQTSTSSNLSTNPSTNSPGTPLTDLEAQKTHIQTRFPAHNQNPTNSIKYSRKRPLRGLGKSSYHLPSLSPLSVIFPGYISPSPSPSARISHQEQNQEQRNEGETSGNIYRSTSENETENESSSIKGDEREPVERCLSTESESEDWHFGIDGTRSNFGARGEGSGSSRGSGKMRKQEERNNEGCERH